MMRGQRSGRRERPGCQALQRDHQSNKSGATRGVGVMKGGEEAKAPDNVAHKYVEDNIQKYPRNFMRRMDYPVFYPARMDI
jgi:hypothetical protein